MLKITQDVNTTLKEHQCGLSAASEFLNDAEGGGTKTPGLENSPSTEGLTQVVPLYTPDGSAVKLFCVHPSHRLALSLTAIASGFQFQVS